MPKKRKKTNPAEEITVEPTQIVATPLQLHIEIEGGCLQEVSVHDAKGEPVEFVYTLDDKDVDEDDEEDYDSTPHEPHCARRVIDSAECDCKKADTNLEGVDDDEP